MNDRGHGCVDLTVMTSGNKTPAACLICWPAAHSRSPLDSSLLAADARIEGG